MRVDIFFGLMQASAMAASVREAARVLVDFVERVFQSGLHVIGNPKVTVVPSYANPNMTTPVSLGPHLALTLIVV